jgi:hypothetical protein
MSDIRHSFRQASVRPGAWAAVPLAAALAILTACQAPSPRATATDRVPPPHGLAGVTHERADASYDWHVLLIAPFGSLLKNIPLTLHEVLLFRDEGHGAEEAHDSAAAGDAECYAADAPAPRFVERIPDQYLLCFKHDRLSRIQASVRVAADRASEVFATACALWLKNAAPSESGGAEAGAAAPSAGPSNAGAADDAVRSAGSCEGRVGAIHFSGRLGEEPRVPGEEAGRAGEVASRSPEVAARGEASPTETPPAEAELSITLDSAPES